MTDSSQGGRTMWDAIVEIAGMLGRYTPWILMVGGAIFAFYKFIDLQKTAQEKAREQFQKELEAAHAELRDTYKQIGEMNQQELQTVSSMLKVHDETAKSTEEQRRKHSELREQANHEREEADRVKRESDRVKAEANAAIEKSKDAARAASEAMAQADKAQKDILAKNTELDRKSEAINQRATKIADLNQKLTELANRVLQSPSDPKTNDLARNVIKDYSFEPGKILTGFASHSSAESAKILKNLIGGTIEELEPILKGGAGFAFWQEVSVVGTNSEQSREDQHYYIGALRQTEAIYESLAGIEVANGKVVNIFSYKEAFAVRAPSTHDWNKPTGYLIYVSFSGDDRSGVDVFTPTKESWDLSDTLRSDNAKSNFRALFGRERTTAWTKISDVRQRPQVFKMATEDSPEFAEIVTMLDNANNFKPAIIAERIPKPCPDDLRKAFAKLLQAVVKGDAAPLIADTSRTDVAGRIAAAVLKPNFRPVMFGTPQGRAVSTSTTSPSPSESYSILCAYLSSSKESQARFTFARGSENKWVLINFEDPAVISTTAAD